MQDKEQQQPAPSTRQPGQQPGSDQPAAGQNQEPLEREVADSQAGVSGSEVMGAPGGLETEVGNEQ